MTKHYPSHQGDGKSGPSSSGSFTRPANVVTRAIAARAPAGDHSGTVELDPELEGVELEPVDELAEPPPPRAHTEDLGDDDVVADDDLDDGVADDDVVEVEAAELIAGGARAQLRGPSYAADDYVDDQATVAERAPSVRGAVRPRDAARDRAIHERETPKPEPRPAPRVDSRPGARGASPERPETGRRRADSAGALGARALEPELARSAAAIDALFPDEESAPGPITSARAPEPRPAKARLAAPAPVTDPGSRSRDDDMRTIRAALGVAGDVAAAAAAAPPRRPESTGVMVNRAATPRPSSKPTRDATELVGDSKPVRAPVLRPRPACATRSRSPRGSPRARS